MSNKKEMKIRKKEKGPFCSSVGGRYAEGAVYNKLVE